MSGVYIKNAEMPTAGRILIVFPSGRVLEVSADAAQDIFRETQAFSIPSHGNLKDADAIRKDWLENYRYALTRSILDSFDDAPTIIPAESVET